MKSQRKTRKKKRNATYKKGFLKVGDGHKLYYECYGNPQGRPVLYLHGGPGAGFSESSKKYFQPQKFNVILFDQRGAKRSRPFASLRANTTPKLVADTKKLLDFLKIKKPFLFGGSWGSTLALAFAIRYPQRVSKMLLSSIFLGSQSSIQHYIGGGVRKTHPDEWERFLSFVPKKYRKNIAAYYLAKMHSKNKKVRELFAYEWCRYELSICRLITSPKKIRKMMEKDVSYRSLSPLEAHYMKHNCFMTYNYILKNAPRLSGIPTTILHGRYDIVCPASDAYDLHQRIPGSRFFLLPAGHSRSENAFKKKIREELRHV